MSLTRLEADLAIHQKLADEPNDVGGLSAQELKKKFDEAGVTIQEYLNETHLPQVEEALEATLDEAKGYADRRIVAVGAGDMASAVYDTQKRRKDVYQYAHDEAVRVLGSAARFGYVALGPAEGTSRNGSAAQASFKTVTDPRGFWDGESKEFVMPQGTQAFGITAEVRWARQTFANCAVRLAVNGEVVAEVTGPNDSSGNYVNQMVMLGCSVQGGDRVAVELWSKASGSYQAEVNVLSLRGEILM